ncbi:MAG: universal stress protein [Halobacteriales archaeon]
MSDDRPPLSVFEDAVFEAVAADAGVPTADLRGLVARHQETVRDLPGVEDVVYEWRSRLPEDPLVHRSPRAYVLAHRETVWRQYDEALGLSPGDDGYAEAVADEYLGEFADEADERGFENEKAHVLGDPAREIVAYAEENNVDRVVMGSHGRDGATRVLLGSVAETVVRRSPTPVTVVR